MLVERLGNADYIFREDDKYVRQPLLKVSVSLVAICQTFELSYGQIYDDGLISQIGNIILEYLKRQIQIRNNIVRDRRYT